MLTIGLIDTHEIVSESLSLSIRKYIQGSKIIHSKSILSINDKFEGILPNLIILGINEIMVEKCLSAVRFVKKKYPGIPLIVYDQNVNVSLTTQYFKAGVKGYILKENDVNEMVNCINAVLNDRFYLCEKLFQLTIHKFLSPSLKALAESKPYRLSKRESEIASYLNQGRRTNWIAVTLGVKASTVSTIKKNIFRKMNIENVRELYNQAI